MASLKKGQFVKCVEWAKHLRKFGKKEFWSIERMMSKKHNKKLIETYKDDLKFHKSTKNE